MANTHKNLPRNFDVDIKVRLRNRHFIYDCDEGKPEFHLYTEAADYIEELEDHCKVQADRIKELLRLVNELEAKFVLPFVTYSSFNEKENK